MRRLLPLLLLLVLPAAADAAPKVPCGPVKAETLRANDGARVYREAGRTVVCLAAKGRRPVSVGRARPTLTRVTGDVVLLAYGNRARSVDAATGETILRLTTTGRIERAILRSFGALAVQAGTTVAKADDDWPHHQVLATNAAPRTLRQGTLRSHLTWGLADDPEGVGTGYLVDAVGRCDVDEVAVDGGYTLSEGPFRWVMCPTGKPLQGTVVFDDSPVGWDGNRRYELLQFRAGTALLGFTVKDRTNSEVEGGFTVIRHDRPAQATSFTTRGVVDTGGFAVQRTFLDPAGNAVLGLRPGWRGGDPVPDATVWAVTAAGVRQLDTGPEVDAGSTTLTGSIASWTHGGMPRTFDLSSP